MLRLLLAALLPVAAHAACVVESKATVALRIAGSGVTLPVEVNGMTAAFLLDTGALRSVVTPGAALRLNLARDQWAGTTLSGIGGIGAIEHPPNADPSSMSVAGVPLARRRLSRDSTLAVTALPNFARGNVAVDGLLGGDFLSAFDLDLDWPNRRLTLYQVTDCTGRFLPWTNDYTRIPATITTDNAIIVTVVVDGRPLRAMLDTGAGASLVGAPGIYRLGLDLGSLMGDPSAEISGVGRRVVIAHDHRFRTLSIGGQSIDWPMIWVEPVRLPRVVDMLLGADWLASRRIWISYTTRQLFRAVP